MRENRVYRVQTRAGGKNHLARATPVLDTTYCGIPIPTDSPVLMEFRRNGTSRWDDCRRCLRLVSV